MTDDVFGDEASQVEGLADLCSELSRHLIDATARLAVLETVHHTSPITGDCCCGTENCLVWGALAVSPDELQAMRERAEAEVSARAARLKRSRRTTLHSVGQRGSGRPTEGESSAETRQ